LDHLIGYRRLNQPCHSTVFAEGSKVQVHVDLPKETSKHLESDSAFRNAGYMHVLLKHSVSQENELISITQRAGSAPHIPSQYPGEVSLERRGRTASIIAGGNVMQVSNHRKSVAQLLLFTLSVQ
jgi:hypothetical protein